MADKKKGSIRDYFSDVKKELFERTVWPTRAEVLSQTVVVIFLLILASLGLGGIDYIVTFTTRALLQGDLVAALFASKVTLFVIVAFVLLFIAYFAIRYVRKNRYNG